MNHLEASFHFCIISARSEIKNVQNPGDPGGQNSGSGTCTQLCEGTKRQVKKQF